MIPTAYMNRAALYRAKGDLDQALADMNMAAEFNIDTAQILLRRGGLYAEMGDLDRSIADYTKAVELQPDFAEAYIHRAEIHRAMGNPERANEDMAKVALLNPPNYAPSIPLPDPYGKKRKTAMSAAGGWKGLIDCEKFKREIYKARRNSLRAYKP